ncbi:response regulator [Sulfitobacter sp. JL08]|uniref:response regulator n=1 Tax=Sulfitobacter sp. JL08 TaxID=2070369 RepID=UPI000E09F551|nr:response regulator [Sulfitobacter sp. JL08]AXI55112.1 response regulator [Sulfitobacter sp. JL08]
MTKRILVIEDQPDNRRILRDLLGNSGFVVTEAENGRIGVEMAVSDPPDLILMDIQMPEMDGYQATREIKASAAGDIPIIAVTSYALSDDETKARGAGCDGYVSKPFSPREILRKVIEFIGEAKSDA